MLAVEDHVRHDAPAPFAPFRIAHDDRLGRVERLGDESGHTVGGLALGVARRAVAFLGRVHAAQAHAQIGELGRQVRRGVDDDGIPVDHAHDRPGVIRRVPCNRRRRRKRRRQNHESFHSLSLHGAPPIGPLPVTKNEPFSSFLLCQ